MRRRVLDYPRGGMFHGQELVRLGTMICMLIVMGMVIHRAADPDVWRWFASGPDEKNHPAVAIAAPKPEAEKPVAATPAAEKPAAAKSEAKAPVAGKPAAGRPDVGEASTGKLVPERPSPHKSTAPPTALAATGPTDLDPAEGMVMDEERQFIEDNKLYMQPLEMHAYKRVVQWVHNQPWALLEKRAKKGLVFDRFNANPNKYRLQVVELDLTVRKVTPCEEKIEGLPDQLTEVCGVMPESGNRIFVAVVIDWPPNAPTGLIWGKAKIAGYFFKLQGYEPGGARPNARPLSAPW